MSESANPPLIATLIAPTDTDLLDSGTANKAAKAIGGGNPAWLAEHVACDIALPAGSSETSVRTQLGELLKDRKIDFVIHPLEGRRKKALIADMDSTMIDQECIDELAAEIGVKDRVARSRRQP